MVEMSTRAVERNLPSNVEAEQAVLGSLLLDPDAITQVAAFLRAEDFYLEKHRWIYETMLDLHDRRDPIDFLSVISGLEQRGRLRDIGGSAFFTSPPHSIPPSPP